MHTISYNTVEEFNMDSKAECDQLKLAHIQKECKKETKTNKCQIPLSSDP